MLERIAIDALVRDRDEPQRLQARAAPTLECRAPPGPAPATGRPARQQLQRLALPAAESGQVGIRGIHAPRAQSTAPRRRVPAAVSVTTRTVLKRSTRAVSPCGGKRRGQRRAGPGQVVLGHPLGQLDDVGGTNASSSSTCDDRLDRRRRRIGGSRLAKHHAGQRARPERHDHARAGARAWRDRVGHAIGEQRRARAPAPRRKPAGWTRAPTAAGRLRAWREPSSCLPRLRASPTGCEAGRPDGRSESASRRDNRTARPRSA